MTTLTALADNIQNQISDSGGATWTQALIEAWCLEAIKDYSNHFLRVIDASLTYDAGNTRIVDLPADFIEMRSVEFPTGNTPPTYLVRRRYTRDDFYDQVGYYDIMKHRDATDPDQIYLSEAMESGEGVAYEYFAAHDYTLDPGDAITVPGNHENLLVAYVVWCAWRERLGDETIQTTQDTLLLSQLASNTDRAWRNYIEMVAKARKISAESGYAGTGSWVMDKHDRVY